MALPAGFLDELRARSPLAPLIGRRAKLERAGRQWKACCPFHGEKTASLYIWEDHYHCFGCGAHGDAITFVMQTEDGGFMEAVQRLAGEAGLEVPRLSPALAEAERRRHTLSGVLEMAAASFQRRLFLPEGRGALDYLLGRGLTEATIRAFGLGWSGEGRGALAADLSREGITPDLLTEAGLLRTDEETGRQFDQFYERVMFPIRDRRGAVISFGGRTLRDAQPKYVNGPETSLFSKRRTLYALDLAREALRRPGGKTEIVVVEGYMDVIALHQAGFAGAVAPLGTALTVEQLGELWRLSPGPVLCFDGDAAGGRAVTRAVQLALPTLAPDRTIRIARLPAGEDPDSLIRRGHHRDLAAAIASARPLSDALYELLGEGIDMRLPEQRAEFRTRLETTVAQIANRALATEYRRHLLDKFFSSRSSTKKSRSELMPFISKRAISDQDLARANTLVCLIVRHPQILPEVEHELELVNLPASLARVREDIWEWRAAAPVLDSHELLSHLHGSGLGDEAIRAFSGSFDSIGAARRMAADEAHEALSLWRHVAGLTRLEALDEQIADVAARFEANPAEAQQLIVALQAEREHLLAAPPEP